MIENSSHSDLLAQLADDFGARYRRGERPTPDEYARKYPQLAAQIHDLLPTIALLEQVEPETDSPLAEGPGKHVGPYKLLEKIGEGAFGVVFMAEQQQPIRRKVAIKVLKAGMDTRQVVARFEAERQALAMMDHENIARVFDAGSTDSGRPYFVMELVKGIPITEYCDQNHLNVDERLNLFAQVCQAVQHAHQKGIIHRDIKPSNALVSTKDGRSVAKVIDFGIAKATQTSLTERTLFTDFRQLIGTPAYMSPEQTHGSLDIDTRSDVYSLGVLLYELLAGSPPFDPKDLRNRAFAEMQRIICEVEPPTPSTRLSTMKDALPHGAAPRIAGPHSLPSIVRGDLDWIVMKCLEKDRARRYATASAVEMDIRRYLQDEPVEASPPSATYKLRKLARKYRVPLRAAAVIAMLLVVATVFSSWQAVQASRAKAAALAQKRRADRQATTATRITESLQQILGLIDPDAAKPPNYTVRQLIDEYAENLEEKLGDQPEAAANLHATIGRSYACWGEREKAKRHLSRALQLSRRVVGEKHDQYADVLVDYARPDASDPAERPQHESDLRRALAIYRDRGVEGQRVIQALWTLQWNLKEQAIAGASEKWSQFQLVLDEALAEAARSPHVEFPKIASIYSALSGVEIGRSDYAAAEKTARRAVAMHLKLHGPDSLETAWGYQALGDALRSQGKLAEALAAQVQGVSIMRKSLPAEHANIAYSLAAATRTLDEAKDSQTLATLFPALAEVEVVELVFREVVEKTQPATHRYDDPAFVAANGLTRILETYLNLSDEWLKADKATEAEQFRQRARLLLENLEAMHNRNPELLPEFAQFRAGVRDRTL